MGEQQLAGWLTSWTNMAGYIELDPYATDSTLLCSSSCLHETWSVIYESIHLSLYMNIALTCKISRKDELNSTKNKQGIERNPSPILILCLMLHNYHTWQGYIFIDMGVHRPKVCGWSGTGMRVGGKRGGGVGGGGGGGGDLSPNTQEHSVHLPDHIDIW